MKRHITAGLSILAVMAAIGVKLASHSDHSATSMGLQHIRLVERSEHAHPGASKALAGIRIRISPSDFDGEIRAKGHEVPKIALASE